MLRGNHECMSVSAHFGFKQECKMKYGLHVYYKFCELFRCLPLAAIVDTSFGRIFCCHGGLSPSIASVKDIETLNRYAFSFLLFAPPLLSSVLHGRFQEPEKCAALLDILWADPVADDGIVDMDGLFTCVLHWRSDAYYTYCHFCRRRISTILGYRLYSQCKPR